MTIDARSRTLNTFVASVTKANKRSGPDQLVLRHALELGSVSELVKKTDHFKTEMSVIIMGNYTAVSSAGFTDVVTAHCPNVINGGHRKILVVGGLGEPFGRGGLKVLTYPIPSILVDGPVRITRVPGAKNSNCSTAGAAWAGVSLLAQLDRRSVFLTEGQSDSISVWKIEPDENSVHTEFSEEHRGEMFKFPNIIHKMVFGAAYRDLLEWSDKTREVHKPSPERIKEVVAERLQQYLEALAQNNEHAVSYLGNDRLNDFPQKAVECELRALASISASTKTPQLSTAIQMEVDEYVEIGENSQS